MSEMNSRESCSRYEEMTTEQLREILRKHAHGELEKEPDTEELFYIMEVLADRESMNPEKQIKSTEEAYATFVKHYAPQMARAKGGQAPTRWTKWAAVAAILAVLIVAGIGTQAFVPNFWEKVAVWTQEFFRFGTVTDGTEGEEPDKEVNVELDSLRDALSQYAEAEELVPNWIPAEYLCADIKTQESPKVRTISAVYEKDGERLIIKIRQEFGSDSVQIEKNEDLIEIYTVDGVDYYIFSNDKYMQTAWISGNYECVIIGKLTIEEMKKVIDSI